jgi:uncharacterized membrane protein YkoI
VTQQAGAAQMTELSSAVQRAFMFGRFHGSVSIIKTKYQTMKKTILYSLIAIVAASVLTGCACCEKCEKHHKEAKQAKMMAQAKVSKDDAQKTALAKVPNSTVKEAEIEKEHGKLVWSFDLTTPDTKDITEVNVDAITGDVVSVEKEAAESEAKEAGEKDKK